MTISEGDFFMIRTMVYHRKKIWVVFIVCAALLLGLVGRLLYLMGAQSEYYSKKADDFMSGNVTSKLPGEKFWISMEIFWQITGQSVPYR